MLSEGEVHATVVLLGAMKNMRRDVMPRLECYMQSPMLLPFCALETFQ